MIFAQAPNRIQQVSYPTHFGWLAYLPVVLKQIALHAAKSAPGKGIYARPT